MNLLTIGFWVWAMACVCALVHSVLLGLHAWEHRRFARRRRNDGRPINQSWRVALLAPCKGLDLDLEQNLQHLLVQDYSNYEVLFIVESECDPAFPIIQRVAACAPVPVQIIVAGQAALAGQKNHNLSVATEHVSPDVKILAFVDSDTRPAPEWLGRMVSRLYRPAPAAVTGYRWYVPEKASLTNCLLYSINSSVAALLGAGSQQIVWGGSWAVRRDDFDAIGIRGAWSNTLTDDLVATKSLHSAKLSIDFEPACMAASPMDYSLRGMLSFLRRQHMIGRLYAPQLWYQSLAMLLVSAVAVVGAVTVVCGEFWIGSQALWPAVMFLAAWYSIQVYRGLVRRDMAREYIREWTPAMSRSAWFDVFCSPLGFLLNTCVMLSACWGNRIVWRGITYDMDRHGRILRVTRASQPCSDGTSPATSAERQLRVDPPQRIVSSIESSAHIQEQPTSMQSLITGERGVSAP